ncbi:uncharacterized protein VTP21DRAFT_11628 [Calcarisporiella thermophila]|uniref:uncharacterized protein n=1 Tax=Calcarisporiella thermophila TaxID=911321 RepID=UPI0037441E3C
MSSKSQTTSPSDKDIFGDDSSLSEQEDDYDQRPQPARTVMPKPRIKLVNGSRNTSQSANRNNGRRMYLDDDEEEDEEDEEDYSSDEEDELEEEADTSDDYDEDAGSRRSKSKYSAKSGRGKRKASKKKSVAASNGPVIPLGDKTFEQILWCRPVPSDPSREEFLIKYKNTSYRHLDWIPREEIENWHMGKNRIKRFLAQFQQRQSHNEKDMYNQDYTKVDRIIDEGELEDPMTGKLKVFYLTKWCSLPYDQCTWESTEELQQIAPDSIEIFHKRRDPPDVKLNKTIVRQHPSQFKKLSKSPRYKYGNELRSYQLEGVNWLLYCWFNQQPSILADEMGLGKTVQSVTFLNEIYTKHRVCGPFIVVAPLSTVPHWERAFDTWTDLNVVTYRGNDTARNLIVETEFFYRDSKGAIIPGMYKFDVLITTYEMVMPGSSHLKPVPWRVGIFDEAHRLKSKTSKVGEMLKQYRIAHKVLLTGTPLQNSTEELWALLNFMEPDRFPDERIFMQEFGSVKSSAEVSKLQGLLKPLMLRRFKEDVEKTIPVKEETVIEVELTSAQKRWYRAILEKNFAFLKKGAKGSSAGPTLTNIMMELRKVCIHPYLIQGAEERIVHENNAHTPEDQFKCMIEASGKLVLLDKLLKKLYEGEHKVLVFSQFTSCLDILADYLRGRGYNHERIDGSIRGEQRQAAIDRFSTRPLEESFVFLLCTRAGGVGINLTAADTVVIFDSDWNPQNDLQAQARCHRIGQTKRVQTYRLICRNTYEKEMFDRAGLKLGLDKAVMQKMDIDSSVPGSEDDSDVSKPLSSLSKKEIEELLKKGVYGAMMDDDASAKFCAEDIDQILERRTMVIRHEGNEKGSIFSKASFAPTSADDDDVDLNDPDFWDKWAKKASLNVTEVPEWQELIVTEPRQRRQVQRFGAQSAPDTGEEDVDSEYDENGKKKEGLIPWSLAERTKYERKLMVYGYSMWEEFAKHFPRRRIKDLKAVTRALILKIVPLINPTCEEDRRLVRDLETMINEEPDTDFQGFPTEDHIPYRGANKKQIVEYKSFLVNATPEYHEHIERKARNIALRLQMLYNVHYRIVPKDWEEAKKMPIPSVTGHLPAPWWGEQEDRDLLLHVVKFGYSKYEQMRAHPEFCFYGRNFIESNGDAGSKDDMDDDAPVTGISDATPQKHPGIQSIQTASEVDTPSRDIPIRGYDYEEPASSPAPSVSATADEQSTVPQGDLSSDHALMWPSKADLGVRLRRIIAACMRDFLSESRKQRFQELQREREIRKEEQKRQKEERMLEKQRLKQLEQAIRWTKREKADFLKTIMSFGVEVTPGTNELKWDRFREISSLTRKDDESLTVYYAKMVEMCQEVVEHQERGLLPPEKPFDERYDPDPMPGEKCLRLLKRVEMLRRVREQVLPHPEVDDLLDYSIRTGLPRWWITGQHDKDFLVGLAKHGINRSDLILDDRELGFYWVRKQMEESNEEFQWLKESQINRRIEHLCNLVLRGKRPAFARRRGVKAKAEEAARRAEQQLYQQKMASPAKKGITLKLKLTNPQQFQQQHLHHQPPSSGADEMSDISLSDAEMNMSAAASDSGEDTDEMLEKATKQIRGQTASGGRHHAAPGGHKRSPSSSFGTPPAKHAKRHVTSGTPKYAHSQQASKPPPSSATRPSSTLNQPAYDLSDSEGNSEMAAVSDFSSEDELSFPEAQKQSLPMQP